MQELLNANRELLNRVQALEEKPTAPTVINEGERQLSREIDGNLLARNRSGYSAGKETGSTPVTDNIPQNDRQVRSNSSGAIPKDTYRQFHEAEHANSRRWQDVVPPNRGSVTDSVYQRRGLENNSNNKK
jgi:hypothetical protein